MTSSAASGPSQHVVLEGLARQLGVGIDPGDAEHRQPAIDAPFDERAVGGQIEHVELVDPRRHDQDRPLEHGLGRRRVLDQLDEVVLIDDLAGRDREIAADLEGIGVGLADAQIAAAGRDVLGQHVHPARQVLGIRRQRLAQELRIGEHEIRRRDRVGDLADVEVGLLLRERIEPFGILDQMVGPGHRQEIGLLEEVEELVARPFGVAEALVLRARLGHRLGLLAGHALDRAGP